MATNIRRFNFLDQLEILEAEDFVEDFPLHIHDKVCITLATKGVDGIGVETIKPKKNSYKGPLVVLINGRTSSAAGDFSGLVKAHDRAIFIGEETGGNPYINTAGVRLTLELPHSKVRMMIPTLKYEVNIDATNDGHGMRPDYPISLSIQDIINQQDKVMEFTLSHFRN